MAFSVADVIEDGRNLHPAFTERGVPSPVLVKWLSNFQRRLYDKATAADSGYLVQQMSVVFAADGSNGPGVAGAGSSGGLPAIDDNGTVTYGDLPAGSLADIDFADADEILGPQATTSGTSTSTTLTGAGWTVNAYANFYYEVVAGLGFGTRRQVASNTTDTIVWDEAVDVVADETTVWRIVDPETTVDLTQGVVTDVPALGQRVGYLVKVTAGGQPYLDLTAPLVADYDVGIPLPPLYRLLGGSVRRTGDGCSYPCDLTLYGQRYVTRSRWSAYEQGGSLFLAGGRSDWAGVQSLDLRYCPIPPALTATSDIVFLDEQARDATAAALAAFMGQRLKNRGVTTDELDDLKAEAMMAEQQFLSGLSRPGQARRVYVSPRFDA